MRWGKGRCRLVVLGGTRVLVVRRSWARWEGWGGVDWVGGYDGAGEYGLEGDYV